MIHATIELDIIHYTDIKCSFTWLNDTNQLLFKGVKLKQQNIVPKYYYLFRIIRRNIDNFYFYYKFYIDWRVNDIFSLVTLSRTKVSWNIFCTSIQHFAIKSLLQFSVGPVKRSAATKIFIILHGRCFFFLQWSPKV